MLFSLTQKSTVAYYLTDKLLLPNKKLKFEGKSVTALPEQATIYLISFHVCDSRIRLFLHYKITREKGKTAEVLRTTFVLSSIQNFTHQSHHL